MRAARKTRAKSGAKSKPAIECAGNLVARNYWVKVGFSREELGALAVAVSLRKNWEPNAARTLKATSW